jgi:hypothetical protein
LNPWKPISNPLHLKQLGKLGEEASELCTVVSRCIIQGVDQSEPVTGKPNKLWLEEELADVLASIDRVMEGQNLDSEFILKRADMKRLRLIQWENML